ncbi:MAG: hypothetical protein RR620_12605 [Clostridium sp.]|uniref:hypothetical protein n=1 Tax=Anaerorhabdus sp. TaxID=1872524 RepID=UPI002FCBFF31
MINYDFKDVDVLSPQEFGRIIADRNTWYFEAVEGENMVFDIKLGYEEKRTYYRRVMVLPF